VTNGPGGSYYDPNWGAAVTPGDTENAWQAWQLQNARDAAAANSASISGLNSASNGVNARTQNVRQGQSGIIQSQMNSDAAWEQQNQDLVNQLSGAANSANAFDWNALGSYQSGLGANTASNNQYVSNLGDLYGQLANPLQSQTHWAGDLTSQAAIADPQALAAQNQALGFLGGAMNGSLNYTSQAAGAYADPASIQAEYGALGQLQNAANGGLNVTSQAAQVYADPALVAAQQRGVNSLWDVSQGANDVRVGQMDPAAYAAQQDALAQYKSLTTPQLTDAEKFIYENERLNAERDERANREAVMSGLRQRGMGGSGMELVNSQLANQQTSQNRLLGDLGANAQAINRSMQALAGYGGLSSTMSQQANELGTANANRRTAALGMYTDAAGQMRSRAFDEAMARGTAADQVAMSNMNRQLQAEGMSFDAAGTIRNQSFNEEYSRGMAADTASANNQRTQLTAGIGYGNQANTMQQQAFQRGAAADQTAQFNRAQSIGVSEWNDQFAQNERNAQWNRGLGMANTGLQANQQNATNLNNSFNAGYLTNQSAFGRTSMALNAQDSANARAHDDTRYTNGLNFDLGNSLVGDENNAFNRQAGVTSMGINATNQGTAAVNDIGQSFAGTAATRSATTQASAAAALADKNNPGGLLGTGILGRHDPLNPGNWFRGSIS
jgi:hypothetical protein